MTRFSALAVLFAVFTALSFVGLAHAQSDFPYSVSTNASCDNNSPNAWALVAPQGNNAYAFGSVDKADAVNSTDFNGQTFTSIAFALCGYSADSTADSNPINFGVFNLATGALISSIGSVSFDGIAHCNPTVTLSNNCKTTVPTMVVLSGSVSLPALSSKTEGVGFNFPASSTTSHDVEDLCGGTGGCSAAAMSHGGIAQVFYAGASKSPGDGLATSTTFTPCPFSQSNTIGQNAGCGLATGASLVGLTMQTYMAVMLVVLSANSLRQKGGKDATVAYLRRTSPFLIIVGVMFFVAWMQFRGIP